MGVQPEALRKEGGRELGTRRGFLSIFLEPPSWGLAFGGGEADWKEPRWGGGWLCLHRWAQACGRGLGSYSRPRLDSLSDSVGSGPLRDEFPSAE